MVVQRTTRALIDVPRIHRAFEPLYDHPCWGLHYSSHLNLSINFGKPSLRVREPRQTHAKSPVVRRMFARRNVTLRGQWWLWMQMCYWRVAVDDRVLATNSTATSTSRMECALGELEGQKLLTVDVNPVTGATRFEFDLGCRLECRRFEKNSTDDLWHLYRPHGRVLVVYADGTSIDGLRSKVRIP